MNLRKKLLKVVAVIYGCTALLSFGELPQKMINDVQEVMRYLEVPGYIRDQTRFKEIPQKDTGRGNEAYTRFNHDGYPIISINKDMFSDYEDPVKQLLIYHRLLREAVRVKYFSWVPYEQYKKDRQCYWREENNYQRCSLSKEKLSQSLSRSQIFFLAFAGLWLANDVKTKIGSLGKILGSCSLVSAVIMGKKLFSSYKSSKRLSAYKNERDDYEKMLKFMAREEQGNIIDNLGVSEARLRSPHAYRREADKMWANFPDESWASRINVRTSTSYNRGKCIQMRDNFLVNIGTLALMFYRDRKNYDEYIDYLEKTIEVNQSFDGFINFPLLEQRLYADEFIENTGCKEDVMVNLLHAGNNKGPYAKIADGYLREKILGLFEKDLQVYQGDVKEYIRAREKDLQVYQGNIKEYIRVREQGQRPIYLKLQRPAWWDEPLAENVLDDQE